MPHRSENPSLARQLAVAATAVALVMLLFEAAKQTFFPHISVWQSHTTTICFTTFLATLAAWLLGRKVTTLNAELHSDIAERERVSAALAQSETRYRSLFERNKAGVFRSSPEGYFIDCNDAFARMFGYEREELLKLPPKVLYPGGSSEREARLGELHRTRQLSDYEICYRHKNGSQVWAIQNVSLIKDENGKDVTEGTVVDVTERRRLEESLRQSQKMEAVGRLAGGIAHDFNNLLTIIMGYSGQLAENYEVDQKTRERANRIAQAAERAAALTRQLLAFSRKQVLEVRIINLNSLVGNLEHMLRRLIGEDIHLTTRTAPDLNRVKADPGQIEQVIMNLVVNSRDAMPAGGELVLETANVVLDENYAATHSGVAPGNYVQLAVSDSGHGMTPDTQARIFEPFFTTKEMGQGTGLGLSTVYGIVKQSGGHIAVYSEVGHGTTFRVYLPVTTSVAQTAKSSEPAAPHSRAGETVLLVEDDSHVRELARSVLAGSGYSVVAPDGAGAAISVVEKRAAEFHLLITDVIMPGINGRALAQLMASHNAAAKVLYMSGYTDNTIDQYGLLDSGTHFLQKPFTPSALAKKVREVLDGARKPN